MQPVRSSRPTIIAIASFATPLRAGQVADPDAVAVEHAESVELYPERQLRAPLVVQREASSARASSEISGSAVSSSLARPRSSRPSRGGGSVIPTP